MTGDSGDVALRGLQGAIERLRQWIANGDYESPVELLEALGHVYILEESAKSAAGQSNPGNWDYYTTRDADPAGRTTAGVVYVRGLNVHAQALVEQRSGSRPFTTRGSYVRGGDKIRGKGVTLTWKALEDLPAPGRPESNGRDIMYSDRVAGREVLETLDEVMTFFVGLI